MDCTVDLANCDVIFHSSHVKVLVVGLWNRHGVQGLSGVWLRHAAALWGSFSWQSQNQLVFHGVGTCWVQRVSALCPVFEGRWSVTMIEWTRTHTHDMHAAGCCNICCWGPFCWVETFSISLLKPRSGPIQHLCLLGRRQCQSCKKLHQFMAFSSVIFFTIRSDGFVWK